MHSRCVSSDKCKFDSSTESPADVGYCKKSGSYCIPGDVKNQCKDDDTCIKVNTCALENDNTKLLTYQAGHYIDEATKNITSSVAKGHECNINDCLDHVNDEGVISVDVEENSCTGNFDCGEYLPSSDSCPWTDKYDKLRCCVPGGKYDGRFCNQVGGGGGFPQCIDGKCSLGWSCASGTCRQASTRGPGIYPNSSCGSGCTTVLAPVKSGDRISILFSINKGKSWDFIDNALNPNNGSSSHPDVTLSNIQANNEGYLYNNCTIKNWENYGPIKIYNADFNKDNIKLWTREKNGTINAKSGDFIIFKPPDGDSSLVTPALLEDTCYWSDQDTETDRQWGIVNDDVIVCNNKWKPGCVPSATGDQMSNVPCCTQLKPTNPNYPKDSIDKNILFYSEWQGDANVPPYDGSNKNPAYQIIYTAVAAYSGGVPGTEYVTLNNDDEHLGTVTLRVGAAWVKFIKCCGNKGC